MKSSLSNINFMPIHTIKLVISSLILVLVLQPNPTLAQQDQSFTINFSCVIWETLSIGDVFYKEGNRYEPLSLRPNNRSKLNEQVTMDYFQLYSEVLNAEGVPEYRLVGQCSIPPSANQVLFFIVESKVRGEGTLPLRILGIDDSISKFPIGSFRFLNMANQNLRVGLGGKTIDLPTRSIKVIESNVSSDGGLIPFLVADITGSIVYETRLFGQSRGRDMVFILPPSANETLVNVKFLPQIIPAQN